MCRSRYGRQCRDRTSSKKGTPGQDLSRDLAPGDAPRSHLVDEEHARDELGDPLVDVLVDHLRTGRARRARSRQISADLVRSRRMAGVAGGIEVAGDRAEIARRSRLVDLRSELLGDLGLLRLHHLAHHRREVLPTLRPRVGEVEIMERHVLHDLLLLVHVTWAQQQARSALRQARQSNKNNMSGRHWDTLGRAATGGITTRATFGQRHVLLSLEIVLGRVGVGATDALHRAWRLGVA